MEVAQSISETSPPTVPARVRTPREVALSKPLPERVPWEHIAEDFFLSWGYPRGEFMPEHMAIYGPTGSGKSHFEAYIVAERARIRGSRVVVIATKPADKTLVRMGWPVVTSWPPAQGWTKDRRKHRQVIFWAKANGLGRSGQERQAAMIRDLLEQLWTPDANIIVSFDEIAYLEQELNIPPYNLRAVVSRYWREARGLGITVVASTQRPQGVSRYMHSESTWSVYFTPKDEEDAERMAQVAGNKLYYRRALAELDRSQYEFLLVHNLTGESVISSLPKTPYHVSIPGATTEAPKNGKPVA